MAALLRMKLRLGFSLKITKKAMKEAIH